MTGYTIGSNTVGSPASANSIHNVQECRTYCTSINGATHFTFTPQSGQSWGNCVCKPSQNPLNAMNGAISGKVICSATTSTTTITTTTSTTTISTTTTTVTTTVTTVITTPSSTAACLIEEVAYGQGSSVNDPAADPKRNDAESCRSYCKSNYPTTIYFSWISTTSSWTQGHKRCYCKTSNAGPRVNNGGTFSGNVHCVGKR